MACLGNFNFGTDYCCLHMHTPVGGGPRSDMECLEAIPTLVICAGRYKWNDENDTKRTGDCLVRLCCSHGQVALGTMIIIRSTGRVGLTEVKGIGTILKERTVINFI